MRKGGLVAFFSGPYLKTILTGNAPRFTGSWLAKGIVLSFTTTDCIASELVSSAAQGKTPAANARHAVAKTVFAWTAVKAMCLIISIGVEIVTSKSLAPRLAQLTPKSFFIWWRI